MWRAPAIPTLRRMRRHWITNWDPDDEAMWAREGRSIARRNLVFSIFAEFLGFSVWQLWSVVAAQLGHAGFPYTLGQLFWLVSVPGLVGATLRFPYGFAVPLFGGRNWTVVSAGLLLVPTVLLSVLVQRPATPFWVMLLVAGTAGFGGGNFASSMSNISFFYPDRTKGWALGLNAAGGNIGVAVVQFVVPAVVGLGVRGLNGEAARHVALPSAGLSGFAPFLAAFLVLFVCSGIGNGSAFRMIPALFDRREAASVLAFSSAIAAYGSFFIPQGYSLSLARTGGYTGALVAFVAFYLTCLGATWWFHLRQRSPERAPARAASEAV